MNVLVLIQAKQFTLKSSIDKASLKINDRVDIINDSNKEIKVENAKVTAIAGNEVTLEYTGFTTDTSIPHSIRRVPKKTTSKFVPLQYSDLFRTYRTFTVKILMRILWR